MYNFTSQLLQDLWRDILMALNCNEIKRLCSVSITISNYCNKNDIIEKRKLLGFPRHTNHCFSHDISSYVNHTSYFNTSCFMDNHTCPESIKNSQILKETLLLLYKNNVNLIYGDLICFNSFTVTNMDLLNADIYIFNGHKIIPLCGFDHENILPKEFSINLGAPILYWTQNNYEDGFDPNNKGLADTSVVWLDITHLKDQLISNIKETSGIIFTIFNLNDIIYTIYFTSETMHNPEKYTKDNFIKCLLRRTTLLLQHENFLIINPLGLEENKLFLNLQYFELLKDF